MSTSEKKKEKEEFTTAIDWKKRSKDLEEGVEGGVKLK